MVKVSCAIAVAITSAIVGFGCGDDADTADIEAQAQEQISAPPISKNVSSVSCPDDLEPGGSAICSVQVGSTTENWEITLNQDGDVDFVQSQGGQIE
jgi:hypothetical protein